MKNSTKHLIFVQAVLVSLALIGCSNVKSAKGPTVRDAVVEVIDDGNIPKDPSSILTGRSNTNSFARSNSVWTSRRTVKEPVARGALKADDANEIKSAHKSQSNKRVARRSKDLNVASQRRPDRFG
ncbi:hypothetical protein ACFL5Z_20895 [Planctomycetota bacterium]